MVEINGVSCGMPYPLVLPRRAFQKIECLFGPTRWKSPENLPYMAYVDQYGQLEDMGQDASKMILTPALCRAARGLLDWTQTDLADRSEVSRSTIRDYEGSRHDVHRATAAQLRRAFEDGGVTFVEVDGCGMGVCPKNGSAPTGP